MAQVMPLSEFMLEVMRFDPALDRLLLPPPPGGGAPDTGQDSDWQWFEATLEPSTGMEITEHLLPLGMAPEDFIALIRNGNA
ncbi:hypothetical protein C7444_12318 [Sphaerotilus hippei]|uniref:Uncharacterized protein n=1 Tax=Sphaerotilus hippei TaxID=744406 RepID=A0A318H693_9BURK|nr:hypothetical protein [Sphaerotilus hippei]PXW92767.1 hypothetical protein C7444_12318 [Sphaerotilus hippei]